MPNVIDQLNARRTRNNAKALVTYNRLCAKRAAGEDLTVPEIDALAEAIQVLDKTDQQVSDDIAAFKQLADLQAIAADAPALRAKCDALPRMRNDELMEEIRKLREKAQAMYQVWARAESAYSTARRAGDQATELIASRLDLFGAEQVRQLEEHAAMLPALREAMKAAAEALADAIQARKTAEEKMWKEDRALERIYFEHRTVEVQKPLRDAVEAFELAKQAEGLKERELTAAKSRITEAEAAAAEAKRIRSEYPHLFSK